jgi:hypothetical protein
MTHDTTHAHTRHDQRHDTTHHSWVKKANEYLKMKPVQLVAAYRWLQGVTGDVPEWSSHSRSTRAASPSS